ncbi:MAG: porphobilinogen synthase [Deltaproteobacteria bacterium]
MGFPEYRPRRLRANENLRRLVRETRLSVDNLVMPFFVREGKSARSAVISMPGVFQLSIDNLLKEVKACRGLGIPAALLFGIPSKKDELGSQAYATDGIVQRACAAIKDKVRDIAVITDVCLCEYTSTGHCGVLKNKGTGAVDNDITLELLAKTAVSQAKAGADMVAPSAMMDGQVKAIRTMLDEECLEEVPIMAYSAKYASGFYGPFRDAAGSTPQSGDRRSYQMDPPNGDEAMREIALDIEEGADIIMVKPALAYLDIIAWARAEFNVPLAAYNVSGEYSMVKAASRAGWLDGERVTREVLTGIKRAGADIIITYHAAEVAKTLRK